jgi:short-subunit dehydrogenase
VRGLSENLRIALAAHGIGVSCLFPGGTRSRIIEGHVKDDAQRAVVKQMVSSWMDPRELAPRVVEGIRNNAPYILTHAMGFAEEVREMNALLESAFPKSQHSMPELEAFEQQRRAMITHARNLQVKD